WRPDGVTHRAASRSERNSISPVSGSLTHRLSGVSRGLTTLRTPGAKRDSQPPRALFSGFLSTMGGPLNGFPKESTNGGSTRAGGMNRIGQRLDLGQNARRGRFVRLQGGGDLVDEDRSGDHGVGDAGDLGGALGRADAEADGDRQAGG